MDHVRGLLRDFKSDLRAAIGGRIEDIILFGSYSRGDFTEYSDIDLLILAKGRLSKEETQKIDDLIASYSLKYDIVISGLVYPAETYQKFNTPFLLNVKEEGILV
jgi:predicted nucleotidyltransferase